MTPNEAKALVIRLNTDRKVTQVIDLNDKYYIVEAPKRNVKRDFNDPYFAVNKSTEKILPFFPSAYPAFFEAMRDHSKVTEY